MHFSTFKEHGKAIIRVQHDMDDQESAEMFKATALDLMEKGENEIVLDLSGVKAINSQGIGKILMLYKRLKERGGDLYLTPLDGKVKEVFELLMLDKLFKVYQIKG